MRKGRTQLVGVKVTPEESLALDWQVQQDRAAGRDATRSTLLYEMALRGNLRQLVNSYRASNSSLETNGGGTGNAS